MAYRYNEKTGDFEQVTGSGSSSKGRARKPKGGFLKGLVTVVCCYVLPYFLIAGLVSMCI